VCCVSNRDADPPIQQLLHAVVMLCINYYEAFQRKKRANSWNDCHSRIECLDSKDVSLAPGRAVFSSCGADPSKAKKRLSSPTQRPSTSTSTIQHPAPSTQHPALLQLQPQRSESESERQSLVLFVRGSASHSHHPAPWVRQPPLARPNNGQSV
jgi:hypothetical protein